MPPEPPAAGLPPTADAAALGAAPAGAAAAPASLLAERPAPPPADMHAAAEAQALAAAPASTAAGREGVPGDSPERQTVANPAHAGAVPPGAAAHLLAPYQPAAAQRDAGGEGPWAAAQGEAQLSVFGQPAAAGGGAGGAAPEAALLTGVHVCDPADPGSAAVPQRQSAAAEAASGLQPAEAGEQGLAAEAADRAAAADVYVSVAAGVLGPEPMGVAPLDTQRQRRGAPAVPPAAPAEQQHARACGNAGMPVAETLGGSQPPGLPVEAAAPLAPGCAVEVEGAAGAQHPAGPEEAGVEPVLPAAHQQADVAMSLPPSSPGALAQPWATGHAADARGTPGTPGRPIRADRESASAPVEARMGLQGIAAGSQPGGAEAASREPGACANAALQELTETAHAAGAGAAPRGAASSAPALLRVPLQRVHAEGAEPAASGVAASAHAPSPERAGRTCARDRQAEAEPSKAAAGARGMQQASRTQLHAACAVSEPGEMVPSPYAVLQERAGCSYAMSAQAETRQEPAGHEAYGQACGGRGAVPGEMGGQESHVRKRKALGWVRVGRGWRPRRVRRRADTLHL